MKHFSAMIVAAALGIGATMVPAVGEAQSFGARYQVVSRQQTPGGSTVQVRFPNGNQATLYRRADGATSSSMLRTDGARFSRHSLPPGSFARPASGRTETRVDASRGSARYALPPRVTTVTNRADGSRLVVNRIGARPPARDPINPVRAIRNFASGVMRTPARIRESAQFWRGMARIASQPRGMAGIARTMR